MEFTLPTLTLSALLASFSTDKLADTPVITTHTQPVIAGQWQILLDKSKPFQPLSQKTAQNTPQETSKKTGQEPFKASSYQSFSIISSKIVSSEENTNIHDVYKELINNNPANQKSAHKSVHKETATQKANKSYDLPAIISIEESQTLMFPKKSTYIVDSSDSNKSDLDNPNPNKSIPDKSTSNQNQQQPANTHSDKTQCRELYNFDQDHNMRVSSGAEITLGKYVISHQAEGLPIILMTTTYDNNETDCSGMKIDQTGDSMIAYLKYMDNKMSWCADAQGKVCNVHFNRVYP